MVRDRGGPRAGRVASTDLVLLVLVIAAGGAPTARLLVTLFSVVSIAARRFRGGTLTMMHTQRRAG
jgi:hypothetical protein